MTNGVVLGSKGLCNLILILIFFFSTLTHSAKTLREQRLKEQQEELLRSQNGRVSPQPEEKESPSQSIMGLDLSTWEDRSCEQRGRSLPVLSSHDDTIKEPVEDVTVDQAEEPESVPASAMVVVRERSRTVDEPSQKNTRAKRESRRMRELEQAKFSLELLKVRANSGGASSPSEERRWSLELMPVSTPPLCSPQGTPDSQSSKGSFELLNMDDEAPKAVEESIDSEEPCSPPPESEPGSAFDSLSPEPTEPAEPPESSAPDAAPCPDSHAETQVDLARLPATAHPPKLENYLPTFYVPTSEGSRLSPRRPAEDPPKAEVESISTATNTTSVTRHLRDRRDSARRPVVVVISMQKETPLSQERNLLVRPPAELRESGAQTEAESSEPLKHQPIPIPVSPLTPPPATGPRTDAAVLEKLERLSEQREERQRSQRLQDEREMMEQIRQQKELLERQRLFFAQREREMLKKQRDEALQRIQQSQRQAGLEVGGQQTAATSPPSTKPLRPNSLLLARMPTGQPHARTKSDSTAPPTLQEPPPQLPPPPASAPRERRRATTVHAAEGWAPNLTLESNDRAAIRTRATNKKPPSSQLTTVSVTDKSGKIFFSPKDKVTFAK